MRENYVCSHTIRFLFEKFLYLLFFETISLLKIIKSNIGFLSQSLSPKIRVFGTILICNPQESKEYLPLNIHTGGFFKSVRV